MAYRAYPTVVSILASGWLDTTAARESRNGGIRSNGISDISRNLPTREHITYTPTETRCGVLLVQAVAVCSCP